MSRLIQQHLSNFRQKPRMQAGSLIISVFGDAIYPRGGSAWLGSLIRMLEPLGVNERLIRTAIFRLVKEDWLLAKIQGRRTDYGLSQTGCARIEAASRVIYEGSYRDWDQRWRMLVSSGQATAKSREPLRHFLFWHGFGQLNSQTFIHPSADLNNVLDRMEDEGLSAWRSQLLALVAQSVNHVDAIEQTQVVAQSWDLAQLSQRYKQFIHVYKPIWLSIQKSAQSSLSEQNAFLLRVLLVHDFRRLLLRDPSLPVALLPANWPGVDARQVFNGLYLHCLPYSQRYLDLHLQLADESVPVASKEHQLRQRLLRNMSRKSAATS